MDAFFDEYEIEHVAHNKRTKHYIILVMLGGSLRWTQLR